MLDMLDDYKEAMARKEGGGVARKESEEDPDPSPAHVSKRPRITTGEAKSQPKKRAPAKKEPTAKKGSVAKKQNNKPNKPTKVRQVSRSCMQMNHVQHAETDGSEGRSDLRVRV